MLTLAKDSKRCYIPYFIFYYLLAGFSVRVWTPFLFLSLPSHLFLALPTLNLTRILLRMGYTMNLQ
jgi:hypothetical protein